MKQKMLSTSLSLPRGGDEDWGGARRLIYIATELLTRHKIGKKIQEITERIVEITDDMKNYGIEDNDDGSSSSTTLNEHRRCFALYEKGDNVVGQEEIQRSVTDQLLNDEARRCVISIVGMGGSGKTTLAKEVYNGVKGRFRHHAFIYLSQQFIVTEVLTHIIESVTRQLSREEQEEEKKKYNGEDLHRKLINLLSEKRYLVVIDDIWSTEDWKKLKHLLPDDLNRSRVMLTTRHTVVGLSADGASDHLYPIPTLQEDESWKLFLRKIYPDGGECPPGLIDTGRAMVKRCDGLPLAIVVLGGILLTKPKDLTQWCRVLARVNLYLDDEQPEPCMKILALSYYDLPHHLKSCFLYLGLFPEDYEIRSDELIRLWVAEGFIQKKEGQLLEDVAEDYLDELTNRNMIQVARKRSNGYASRYRIHDLLRDLCISKAKETKFFKAKETKFFEIDDDDGDNGDNRTTSSSTSVRRLALYRSIGENDTTNQSSKALRSMFYFSESKTNFSKLLSRDGKLLRVLHADIGDRDHEEDLPEEIGEEGFLRYLRFSGIHSLPSSIGNLSDLQTIILTESRYAGILPKAIWDLKKLRHLYAYRWKIDGHPRLSNLLNLQTLCLRAGGWIEDGLDKLTNLRKLGILGTLSSYQESLSNAVGKLHDLRSLKLSYSLSIPPFRSFADHKFLYKMFLDGRIENLPIMPPNLVKLTLFGSQLQQDAIVTLKKMKKLRILRIDGNDESLELDEWSEMDSGEDQEAF